MHRGVCALGHPGLSREGRWKAAELAAGEDAALSHLTVAEFWDVSRSRRSAVHVVTTTRRKLDGVNVHTPHQLAYVIHQAEYRHIFSLEAAEACIARANGRRNLHVLERALELRAQGSAGTRSGKEDAFLAQQEVEPLVNVTIEVDFHWPESRRDDALVKDGWTVTRIRRR